MAVIIKTENPQALLDEIKAAIASHRADTWEFDKDDDFTPTSFQWKKQAWFRPVKGEGELRFGIFPPKEKRITNEIYGVFHGKMIELLTTYFTSQFTTATATAKKTEDDHLE